jgi:hypothetical protein
MVRRLPVSVEKAVAKFGLTQRPILLLLRDHHGEIGLAASMSTD